MMKGLMTPQQVAMLQIWCEPLIAMFVDRVAERVRQMEEAKEPRYYSRQDVAQLLHVTLPTVHSFVRRGLLVPERIGGKVLFNANAVDEAVRTGRVRKHMKGGAA